MDKICIDNLVVFANHGVFAEEKVLGQKFMVSVVLHTDTRTAGLTDNLEKSINYGEVCTFINSFMKEHTYDLIEAVAENLATAMLKEITGIKELELTIKKPWAPIGLMVDTASISITRKWHTAYVAVGSNMGDKEAFLDMAAEELENDSNCYVLKVADYIVTEPYGGVEQDDFLNGCFEIKTLYTPYELLALCQSIEQKANRVREIKWGPRTLDLDVLLYDDEVVSTKGLQIPHPQMQLREFVLVPLAQIAPYVVHPLLNKRVSQMLNELQGNEY